MIEESSWDKSIYYAIIKGDTEKQTMDMARAAKELFETNLKYSNGEPVKVVILLDLRRKPRCRLP